MSKADKFFLVTPKNLGISSNRFPKIVRCSSLFTVEVDENVDFRQYVTLSIDKLAAQNYSLPKSDEFTKVTPIIRETFLEYYSLALKYIHETIVEEGEFYFQNRSKGWIQIEYFSKNGKDKLNMAIDFRDNIEDLWLTLYCTPGHKGRPGYRKNGNPTTIYLFRQFLNLTIKFLYDSDSYSIFLEDYIKTFYSLFNGDGNVEDFVLDKDKSVEKILEQLNIRKQNIEKRLIENDNDGISERSRLRGELDGILYAIRTIQTN